jgi:hypothetical protein
MYEPNVERVLAMLRPGDVVLDIGGWARPFNRATHIMDAMPYDSRGFYARKYPVGGWQAYQGGATEHFTAETWIQRDICEKTPYPFADKSVDFVMCSHTLEDIRDPIFVVQEMARIAKRGYIEVPSREWESCRGNEHPRMVGLSHHRWLIDFEGSHIRFTPKSHLIHTHWRYSLPASHLRRMPEDRKVSWLFWDDVVTCEEIVDHSDDRHRELERYVASIRPYSPVRLQGARVRAATELFTRRVVAKVGREVSRVARRHG